MSSYQHAQIAEMYKNNNKVKTLIPRDSVQYRKVRQHYTSNDILNVISIFLDEFVPDYRKKKIVASDYLYVS